MCGIVYAHNLSNTPVNMPVIEQYRRQMTRGTDGFGFFNGKHIIKAPNEKTIIRKLKKDGNKSNTILFHHRFPTSTINVKRAAHPFTTGNYFGDTEYILVHNGVIYNPEEAIDEHQEVYGIEYQSVLNDLTFNDSESLLWDFALTMEGAQKELAVYGGIAFVCIKKVAGKLDKLYFGKNSSKPLNLLRNDMGVMVSSEGKGEPIEDNTLYTYNYELNRLTTKPFLIRKYKLDDGIPYVSVPYSTPPTYSVPPQYNFGASRPRYDSNTDSWNDDEWYMDREGNWVTKSEWTDEDQEELEEYNAGYGIYEEDEDDLEFDKKLEDSIRKSMQAQTVKLLPEPDDSFSSYTLVDLKWEFDPKSEDDRRELYQLFLGLSKRSAGFELLCDYIQKWEGDYEKAYTMMEDDYVAVEMEDESQARDNAMSALEVAIDLILKDRDYMMDIPVNVLWGSYVILEDEK